MKEITPERLRSLIDYDPETGAITWRPRGNPRFDKAFAGKPALATVDKDGYLRGRVDGIDMTAHRAILFMETGVWPDQTDHENGNRQDNRRINLSDVSHQENGRNQGINSRNTSGVPGVYWSKAHGKWVAQAYKSGKRKHLGLFDRFEEAKAAKEVANRQNGYHENHGRRLAWHA